MRIRALKIRTLEDDLLEQYRELRSEHGGVVLYRGMNIPKDLVENLYENGLQALILRQDSKTAQRLMQLPFHELLKIDEDHIYALNMGFTLNFDPLINFTDSLSRALDYTRSGFTSLRAGYTTGSGLVIVSEIPETDIAHTPHVNGQTFCHDEKMRDSYFATSLVVPSEKIKGHYLRDEKTFVRNPKFAFR